MNRYPAEVLDAYDDDGTMPDNVDELTQNIVGHRIVKAEQGEVTHHPYADWDPEYTRTEPAFIITLDNGKQVALIDTNDCCAFTSLGKFLLHPERVDHIITGVGTTDGYTRWHIYADLGDVLELEVGWSAGNPFYYGYGFDVVVQEVQP